MSTAYERFLGDLQERAEVSHEGAERIARAALQTLGERIAEGEARDLATELPPQLAPSIWTDGGPEPFDVDEFLRRVAAREGVEMSIAERHARAFFAVLARTVSAKELADMTAELPKDFAPLLARGPGPAVIGAETFMRTVADRAGLDDDAASRTVDAVLETLAERIAGGEVQDLIARLPARLHEPLRRGSRRGGGNATRMSLAEFTRRVADREGVDPEAAKDHARAVLQTLRKAVGDGEFFDVIVELPDEYRDELALA